MNLKTVLEAVAFVLIFNSVSRLLAEGIFPRDRDVLIQTVREPPGKQALYLIGGCQCRTEQVFDFILNDIPEEMGIFLVEYQNSGVDVVKAGVSVRQHIRKNHYDAIAISVSMGYQISCVAAVELDEITLNPCIGGVGLQPALKKAGKWLPVAHVGLFLAGWAKFLPLVKTSHGQRYSLVLLVDQFDASVSNRISERYPIIPDAVVFSDHDQVIDNAATTKMMTGDPLVTYIDTGHFGTTDNRWMYREPVLEALEGLMTAETP